MGIPTRLMAAVALGLLAQPAAGSTADEAHLSALEVQSHQDWLARDAGALAAIMHLDFRLVAMNGALETRPHVLGTGERQATSPLVVREVRVVPEQVIVQGDTAVVISVMDIDASVRDRALPPRMRVQSVFVRGEGGWSLLARSITPIQQGPGE